MTHFLLGRESISNIHVCSSLSHLVITLNHDPLISIDLSVAILMILVTTSSVLGALLIVKHLLTTLMAFLLLLNFWRNGDVSWDRVACLLIWYHHEIPSIAVIDSWVKVVLQVQHVALTWSLGTVVRRVDIILVLANCWRLLKTLVLRTHEFLHHLASVWLG